MPISYVGDERTFGASAEYSQAHPQSLGETSRRSATDSEDRRADG